MIDPFARKTNAEDVELSSVSVNTSFSVRMFSRLASPVTWRLLSRVSPDTFSDPGATSWPFVMSCADWPSGSTMPAIARPSAASAKTPINGNASPLSPPMEPRNPPAPAAPDAPWPVFPLPSPITRPSSGYCTGTGPGAATESGWLARLGAIGGTRGIGRISISLMFCFLSKTCVLAVFLVPVVLKHLQGRF